MAEPELFPKREAPPPEQLRHGAGSPSPGLQRLNEGVNEAASRLAVLEERLANLRKKTQLTEQSLIDTERESRTDLKALTESVTDLGRKVEEIREKIDAMAGELATVVRKHELRVVEKYLDLWQPLGFVTREEAKLLIRDAKSDKI